MTPLASRIAHLLHPLDEFYVSRGVSLPDVVEQTATSIPQPYRDLLIHEQDMTSTLEKHVGQPLRLHVMAVSQVEGELHRHVTLVRTDDGRPVEYGAIRIVLDGFHPDACVAIRRGQVPLGGILREFNVTYRCTPTAYFSIAADKTVREALALQVDGQLLLFGRHAQLYHRGGELLAEVVEILPLDFD